MPLFLKLLTAAASAPLLVLVSTILPDRSVIVFGRVVTNGEWWSTGAGPFFLIVTLLMYIAAIMMLRRSRHARLAYIVAWVALSSFIPFVAGVMGVGVAASKSALISNLLMTAVIALYLYVGKGARGYFRAIRN